MSFDWETCRAYPYEAAAEIARLRARLEMIADIAEGSTTANSLPHIAKIARGVDEQSIDKSEE